VRIIKVMLALRENPLQAPITQEGRMNARTQTIRLAATFFVLLVSVFTFQVPLFSSRMAENPQVGLADEGKTITVKLAGMKAEVVLRLEQLPQASTIASGMKLDNTKFAHPSLSPDQKWVVFTVVGRPHCWIGAYDLKAKTPSVKQLDFLFDGAGGPARWAPNSANVAVVTNPASGLRAIKIFNPSTQALVASLTPDDVSVESFDPRWEDDSTVSYRLQQVGGQVKEKKFILPLSAAKQ
jgi:hypothetical protein